MGTGKGLESRPEEPKEGRTLALLCSLSVGEADSGGSLPMTVSPIRQCAPQRLPHDLAQAGDQGRESGQLRSS